MKVLLTGSNGLIGSELRRSLLRSGHKVHCLVRTKDNLRPGDIFWNPARNELNPKDLEGFDGIIHLAGENIAKKRWNAEQKRKIRESRVDGTRLLSQAIAKLQTKPKVFISASAIGYYGHRPGLPLSEASKPGEGFLPEVCRDWEAATSFAKDAGVRVVNLRIGIVLTPHGGALQRMHLPFYLGFGGRVGSGRQFMSWISLRDVVRAMNYALNHPTLQGPVNAVSPHPVPNSEFTKTLGNVLRRPTLAPLPAFAARLALGEMADELLLADIQVEPHALLSDGFEFLDPDLYPTLRSLLDDTKPYDRVFSGESHIPSQRSEVFQFFCDPGNLEKITPPWLGFQITGQSTPEIEEGTRFTYRLKVRGIPLTWESRIEHWKPEQRFSDLQERGPYSKWDHTHEFFEDHEGTLMTDVVHYRVPFGLLGDIFGGFFVKKDVEKIFRYREEIIRAKFLSQKEEAA